MRILTLLKLTITNFRSIKHLEIDFGKETNIEGDNETGKSTIVNAHSWLWRGKDMDDDENYDIKPKINGKIEPRIAPTVEGLYQVSDGAFNYNVSIKRSFVEVWKPNEEGIDVFDRNTTEYWIDNDKQKTEKIWKERLSALVDPEAFVILTSPEYVLDMDPKPLRQTLLKLVGGEVSHEELLKSNPEFTKLVEALKVKPFDTYKSEISGQIKKLEEDKKAIPIRIERSLVERPEEKDWAKIEAQIALSQKELDSTHESIFKLGTGQEFDAYKGIQQKKQEAEIEKKSVEADFKNSIADERKKVEYRKAPFIEAIAENDKEILAVEAAIKQAEQSQKVKSEELDKLRKDFDELDEKVFEVNDSDVNCFACGKPLDDGLEKQKEKRDKFNTEKSKKLDELEAKGIALAGELKEIEKSISTSKERLEWVKEERANNDTALKKIVYVEPILDDYKPYKAVLKKIEDLSVDLSNPPKADDTELQAKKAELTKQIAELNGQLADRTKIEESKKLVLQDEATLLSVNQSLMKWKQAKKTLEEFSKVRSSLLESKVNAMFQHIKFELFRTKNDGEQEEICRPTYNEHAYRKVNTANKVKMFLDLVHTFSKYYGVQLPVFLDNRESTVRLPETDLQIVNLRVVEGKKLTITATQPVSLEDF
jgi:DNA repair protein SbcC/Rad50